MQSNNHSELDAQQSTDKQFVLQLQFKQTSVEAGLAEHQRVKKET